MKKSKILHELYFDEYSKWKGDSCEECRRTASYDSDGFLITKPMLTIHHIDGNVAHNEPENLLTLCRPCHDKVHGMRK